MGDRPAFPPKTRWTLRGLPVTIRLLFTCFLMTIGIGYLFALIYLFLLDIQPHQQSDVGVIGATIIKYYGSRSETRLEASLNGSMAAMIPQEERNRMIEWIREGGPEEGFDEIQPILEEYCVSCHNPDSGLPVPPLTTYEEVRELTETDLGTSIRTLARVSHVHMFGLSFIFLLTGSIFALSEVNKRFRLVIVALPFVAIWLDVGSWWFTKYQPLFAYTVIIGGALMGFALGAQIIISIWDMWLRGKTDPGV